MIYYAGVRLSSTEYLSVFETIGLKKPNYQINVRTAEINGYLKKINDWGLSLTPVSLNDS